MLAALNAEEPVETGEFAISVTSHIPSGEHALQLFDHGEHVHDLQCGVEFQTMTTKGRDWEVIYSGSVVGMVWRPKLGIDTRLALAVHTLPPTRASRRTNKSQAAVC